MAADEELVDYGSSGDDEQVLEGQWDDEEQAGPSKEGRHDHGTATGHGPRRDGEGHGGHADSVEGEGNQIDDPYEGEETRRRHAEEERVGDGRAERWRTGRGDGGGRERDRERGGGRGDRRRYREWDTRGERGDRKDRGDRGDRDEGRRYREDYDWRHKERSPVRGHRGHGQGRYAPPPPPPDFPHPDEMMAMMMEQQQLMMAAMSQFAGRGRGRGRHARGRGDRQGRGRESFTYKRKDRDDSVDEHKGREAPAAKDAPNEQKAQVAGQEGEPAKTQRTAEQAEARLKLMEEKRRRIEYLERLAKDKAR